MAHRIETKVGQGISYQLQTSGTPPITCQLVSGPPGSTFDDATKTLTVPGSAIDQPKVYLASVSCVNCQGSIASLSIQINATEDINCNPIDPPTTVKQQFVYNTAPVRVPQRMVGIHGATHQHNGDTVLSENPTPAFEYDFVRTHDASTTQLSEDRVYTRAAGMWRNIEYAPGQYDWGPLRRWSQKFNKPIMFVIFGTPEFYVKYNDGSADAYRALGVNDKFLYPGSGNFNSPPADPQRVADLIRSLLNDAVLGPKVYAVELWNEAMLPHDGAPRWSAAWGAANYGNYGAIQPFYCGTAEDMAGMAKAYKDAGFDRPLYACGFVDVHSGSGGQYSFDRMLNATAGGVALKDMIDAVSVHWYDYTGEDLNGFVRDMTNYRARIDALGKPLLPMMNSESGDFRGTMSATQVQRLILVAAATKLQGFTFYRYSNDSAGQHMGNPVTNAATRNGITAAHDAVAGKTICEAAILVDGRVWVHTNDGQQFTA